jgi:hypothetical protein
MVVNFLAHHNTYVLNLGVVDLRQIIIKNKTRFYTKFIDR